MIYSNIEIDQSAGSVVYPWLKLTKDYLVASQGTMEHPLYYLMPWATLVPNPKRQIHQKMCGQNL